MTSYYFSSLIIFLIQFLSHVSSSFDQSHPIDFTYKNEKEWGKTYKTCSDGKNQSPININEKQSVLSKSLQPLTRFYKPATAFLVDNGVNIGVRYTSDHASMIMDGKNYTMRLMHWHSPSEHRLNGVQYPLELHMVHTAPDESLAVVGILYQFGQPDQFIQSINTSLTQLTQMVKEHKNPVEVSLGKLDTRLLGKKTNKYYRYNGSLTTPPCTESVIWTLLPRIKTVSEEQVEAIKSPLTGEYKLNFRPVQPLNGRQIQMYYTN
ncbi:alpha carbonic anhydrase 1, chloroplastic-like [Euphorbia lathyris]|uniref:alpha carbonic anhydrase 1, chloroplastic-like n=1 Tax=Euphorbia lathyris TaxID=212925 RepID=UPI003314014E